MSNPPPPPLEIDYYSDVLCVWAWIAEVRLRELEAQWGDRVRLNHHYINLFGDTRQRMANQWADRNGFDGFATHVAEAVAPFDGVAVHSAIWRSVRPASSATAHLLIKAAAVCLAAERANDLALALRQAFFSAGRDIGQLGVTYDVAAEAGFDTQQLRDGVDSGAAFAALMSDYRRAEENTIKGSPSWVMNDGRQTLYGNVGYRILHSNIEELLKRPQDEASWC